MRDNTGSHLGCARQAGIVFCLCLLLSELQGCEGQLLKGNWQLAEKASSQQLSVELITSAHTSRVCGEVGGKIARANWQGGWCRKDRLDIWAKRDETWELLFADTTDPFHQRSCLRSEVNVFSCLLSSIHSGLSSYNLPLPQSQNDLTHCKVTILIHHQIVSRSIYNTKPKQWFSIPPTMKPKYWGWLPSETFSEVANLLQPCLISHGWSPSTRCSFTKLFNEQTCVGVSPCMVSFPAFVSGQHCPKFKWLSMRFSSVYSRRYHSSLSRFSLQYTGRGLLANLYSLS